MALLAYPRVLPFTCSIQLYDNSNMTHTFFGYFNPVNTIAMYQLVIYKYKSDFFLNMMYIFPVVRYSYTILISYFYYHLLLSINTVYFSAKCVVNFFHRLTSTE